MLSHAGYETYSTLTYRNHAGLFILAGMVQVNSVQAVGVRNRYVRKAIVIDVSGGQPIREGLLTAKPELGKAPAAPVLVPSIR